MLFTQSQLFGNAPFWNSCVLVVTHCAIYFKQTSGNVPSKLKQTPTWMTCTKQQPSILYCDIYSSWKQRPTPLSGTHWYPVICGLILIVSTSHWSISKKTYLKNFFLSFRSHLLAFRIGSEPKQLDAIMTVPLSFQATTAFSLPWLDISATSRYPLFFFRTSFFLEVGTSFKRSALKVPIVGMFLRDHWSINWNELKTLSTEKSIGFRLPSESTGKLSTMLNAPSLVVALNSFFYLEAYGND